MERVIGLVLTFIMTFVGMAYAMTTVGFVTGSPIAAAIVSLFVGGGVFITVWVLLNKKNGLKF